MNMQHGSISWQHAPDVHLILVSQMLCDYKHCILQPQRGWCITGVSFPVLNNTQYNRGKKSEMCLNLLIIVQWTCNPAGGEQGPPCVALQAGESTAPQILAGYGWMGRLHVRGVLIPAVNELANGSPFTLTPFSSHIYTPSPLGLPTGPREAGGEQLDSPSAL